MISSVDQLLLTEDQQQALKRAKIAWNNANQKGDTAAMNAAHQQAEAIRAAAGYSGGENGGEFRLLRSAGGPAGYGGYETLVQQFVGNGLSAIAAGRDSAISRLEEERNNILEDTEQARRAANSAVWNTHRLASDGLLSRGLNNTGLADVITATALNQASANAYQALLARNAELSANRTAQAEAEADARYEAAELQEKLATLLGDAYLGLFEADADRNHALMLQELKDQASLKELGIRNQAALDQGTQDYFHNLALAKLKRQWELEDLKRGW